MGYVWELYTPKNLAQIGDGGGGDTFIDCCLLNLSDFQNLYMRGRESESIVFPGVEQTHVLLY